MSFRFIYLIFVFMVISCSTLTNFVNRQSIRAGLLNTVKNQDYDKLKADGKKFLLGYIHIYYNGIDVTRFCSLSLESEESVSLVFDDSNDLVFPVNEGRYQLNRVWCIRNKLTAHFRYTFNDIRIPVISQNSYLGVMKLYFTSEERDDPNNKYNLIAPWLDKIDFEYNLDLKKEIELKYSMNESVILKIPFKSGP